MIDVTDRAVLLKLARDAIVARATGQHPPPVPDREILAHKAAVFVTLHNGDALRGTQRTAQGPSFVHVKKARAPVQRMCIMHHPRALFNGDISVLWFAVHPKKNGC